MVSCAVAQWRRPTHLININSMNLLPGRNGLCWFITAPLTAISTWTQAATALSIIWPHLLSEWYFIKRYLLAMLWMDENQSYRGCESWIMSFTQPWLYSDEPMWLSVHLAFTCFPLVNNKFYFTRLWLHTHKHRMLIIAG